eukprot:TRINITY_DN6073_c0_g3_i1.p1 TRINITY_DN6073_c0_g3~~TRINITY_DN6073_c0_g3_i1.p1  ORF type:complete len:136 (-),score=13.33 TRINITY_DN6073_c0_g3_i1:475-831(-)
MDWEALCSQVGLTPEIGAMFSKASVGKDRLKSVKDALPDFVTYDMLNVHTVMQKLGVLVPPPLQHVGQGSPRGTESSWINAHGSEANSSQAASQPIVHPQTMSLIPPWESNTTSPNAM